MKNGACLVNVSHQTKQNKNSLAINPAARRRNTRSVRSKSLQAEKAGALQGCILPTKLTHAQVQLWGFGRYLLG